MLNSLRCYPNFIFFFYVCKNYYMYCYKPITLINNSRHFNEKVDKVFRQVPCGKCGSCRTALQNSFEARVYYEYLMTEEKQGFTFFQTFTYNEALVPYRHGIRCFSRSDIRSFTKNLQDDWRKKFGRTDTLKYFITCEYGMSEDSTYRPHYHALFFVTEPGVTVDDFARMTENRWKRYNLKGEGVSLGFTDTNNPDPRRRHAPSERIVNAQGALSYVSKYVCKDFDFMKVVSGQERNTGAHLDCDPGSLTKEDKSDMFPFHRQSNGLGLCIKDMIPYKDLLDGRVKIPDRIKEFKYVALPQYIDRKVFYDYNSEDKCFHLNSDGLSMKAHRDLHNHGNVKKSIELILNNFETMWKVGYDYISKKLPCFDSWSEARLSIHDWMSGRSLDDLATYILYYKDLILPGDLDHLYGKDLVQRGSSLALVSRIGSNSTIRLVDEHGENSSSTKRYRSFILSKLRPRGRFDGFEEIIHVLNVVNQGYCSRLQDIYIQNSVEKSRRKYIHSLLY